jgi:hypothetical protein
MAKRGKQNGFAKDFIGEAQTKGNIKSLAGVVGMPDQEDWQNICSIISVYRKESIKRFGFDILVDCIASARKDYAQYGGKYESKAKGFNLVNKDSNMRYHFELPESFVHVIEKAYPLMFVDKNHYHWFCRNFSELRISDRF